MREYSTPAVVDVPASARMTDTVFERAEDRTRDWLSCGARAAWRRLGPGRAARKRSGRTSRRASSGTRSWRSPRACPGIRFGDRVAILSRTRYEWTLFDYALWPSARSVPVYPTSSAEQVFWMLNDSGRVGGRGGAEDPARPSPRSRPAAPAARASWQLEPRARCDELYGRGARHRARRVASAGARSGPRDCRDDHLHLGHHRAPEGL